MANCVLMAYKRHYALLEVVDFEWNIYISHTAILHRFAHNYYHNMGVINYIN